MIVQGLDVPGAKSSLTVNVMECVPVVLQQIVNKNRERPVSETITVGRIYNVLETNSFENNSMENYFNENNLTGR